MLGGKVSRIPSQIEASSSQHFLAIVRKIIILPWMVQEVGLMLSGELFGIAAHDDAVVTSSDWYRFVSRHSQKSILVSAVMCILVTVGQLHVCASWMEIIRDSYWLLVVLIFVL